MEHDEMVKSLSEALHALLEGASGIDAADREHIMDVTLTAFERSLDDVENAEDAQEGDE